MGKRKFVKLINRGYIWYCPTCDIRNEEEEEDVYDIVECISCGSKFKGVLI